jgi:hypothetical protein
LLKVTSSRVLVAIESTALLMNITRQPTRNDLGRAGRRPSVLSALGREPAQNRCPHARAPLSPLERAPSRAVVREQVANVSTYQLMTDEKSDDAMSASS